MNTPHLMLSTVHILVPIFMVTILILGMELGGGGGVRNWSSYGMVIARCLGMSSCNWLYFSNITMKCWDVLDCEYWLLKKGLS